MKKYVTATGRAIPIGRTTRRSLLVKRPKARPLPFHLQCHPPAQKRTTRNPGCTTYVQPEGYLRAIGRFSMLEAVCGVGLSALPDRVRVVIEGVGTWYTSDSAYAFTWAKSARLLSLTVKVYIDQ